METLDFTHITPSGNTVEINVKNGDVVGYNGRSGYIKFGPVWHVDGAMFIAGKTSGYMWFSEIRSVNGVELDDFI